MAKKIAAPFKAARKTPTAKKAATKKVAARKASKAPSISRMKRFAAGGPAGPNGPNSAPSGTHDTKTSSGKSQNSSSRGPGGPSGPNSSSSGTHSTSSGSSRGGAQGGQRGYNSGTSGSRYGGASTQGPGMGRNEGRVGPVSPMSGQGTSFATNKAARDDTLRRAYGIDDRRGRMGPFKGDLPNGYRSDRDYGRPFNPNNPYTGDKAEKSRQTANYERDKDAREQARAETDFYRNPQEIREAAYGIRKAVDRMKQLSESASYGQADPLSQERFRTNVVRSAASSQLPDIKIGAPRSGTRGGFSGGGMGGANVGGWKAGGIVKTKSKTFKKK